MALPAEMAPVDPLIETHELAERLTDVRVFDIRWSLTDANHGIRQYEQGHIPGALFVDLEQDLTGTEGPGRHPLPPIQDFAATLGRLGVTPDDEVIVYDDVSGTIAARMWWMLRSAGHERARVLDGGFDHWVAEGRAIEQGINLPRPSDYPAPGGYSGVVTIDQLEGRLLLDARASERYRGDTEPVDPKAGHIPGAVSFPTAMNIDASGRMKDPAILARLYEGYQKAVTSCGSGVTACHDALAMVVAGFERPDVYIGSFSEWSRLDRPVSTGPNP